MNTRPAGLPPIIPLAVIVGVSPFATDMYIAALPAIATELGTTTGGAQLTLTAFLVAYAVGQVAIGPVSDGIGRRPVLVGGLVLFVLASIACALTPDVTWFVIARVLQGIGGAAGSIAGRAMVTDKLEGPALSRTFGTLAAVNSIGPVVAPLAGGLVLTFGSWRTMFWILAASGVIMLAIALAKFAETLPDSSRGSVGFRANGQRYAALLRIPRFRWYIITGMLSTIGFFAYIATSSFVFQEQFGYSEGLYTIVFATNAFTMVLTTLLFRRLVARYSDDTLLTFALLLGTIGASGVLVSALAGWGPVAVWISLTVVTGAWGISLPAVMTRTQTVGRAFPGTAGALYGGLSFGAGGLSSPLAGVLGGTALTMGLIMTSMFVLAVACQALATRRDAVG